MTLANTYSIYCCDTQTCTVWARVTGY